MTDRTKLQIVEEEIKEVLRKHNVAASVSIHQPGIALGFLFLNTDYSCVYQIDDENFVMKCTQEDIEDSEIRHEKIKNTSNMLHLIYQTNYRTGKFLEIMSNDLDYKSNLKQIDFNEN